MLTRLRLKNFKQFPEADIPLGNSVVFIGPNNSGKTTALQALALWDLGLRNWNAKRGGKDHPAKRPGVTINRRDVVSIPVPAASLLWCDLHTRTSDASAGGASRTQNIRIEIRVDGISNNVAWSAGLEFDYSNEESIICRPLRDEASRGKKVADSTFDAVPPEASGILVAYLPPISGLADREFIKHQGEIGFLIGQGQTAQVLRNLCFRIYRDHRDGWATLVGQIENLFGLTLQPPQLIPDRSEIVMEYKDPRGNLLDLSSSGRGLQQTLLLMAHLLSNPNTILLLDEPDAHLEILRQRQIYRMLTTVAQQQGSQVIAASHSEVVLNEAAGQGTVVAFVGKPHLLNKRSSQVFKALATIGWDQYYQAEQTGWVLYLEDSTDMAILAAFAETLNHPAAAVLEKAFCHYVSTNVPEKARDHFYGLREGKPDLIGVALFDRLDKQLEVDRPLRETAWAKREIENYFCRRDVLLRYADKSEDDLFSVSAAPARHAAMDESISQLEQALRLLGRPSPFSDDIKATDDFLDPLFKAYFGRLGLPLLLRKSDYHFLAGLLLPGEIDPEVTQKLDLIVATAVEAAAEV